ncbi:MAG: hypothetical protein ACW99Q_29630 [Candidatus Kariarchaeaceae archaeon]|jgi:hypothetical protein
MIYDVEAAFKKSGLSKAEIQRIKHQVRKDFPNDDMMYELHIIRILNAMRKGYWKLDDS